MAASTWPSPRAGRASQVDGGADLLVDRWRLTFALSLLAAGPGGCVRHDDRGDGGGDELCRVHGGARPGDRSARAFRCRGFSGAVCSASYSVGGGVGDEPVVARTAARALGAPRRPAPWSRPSSSHHRTRRSLTGALPCSTAPNGLRRWPEAPFPRREKGRSRLATTIFPAPPQRGSRSEKPGNEGKGCAELTDSDIRASAHGHFSVM